VQPDERPGTGLERHIAACNNADLPGRRLPLFIGTTRVGFVLPELAAALAGFSAVRRTGGAVVLDDAAALDPIAAAVAAQGFGRRRREMFDVRADTDPTGPVLTQIDRGALPAFGITATGVHVNGLVQRADGAWLWVARRAADKALDPNKLDHIVAGGVCAGMTPGETLVKEAEEEAAIPEALASQAAEVGVITYALERHEGLRRDRLICYDLWLPEDFQPAPTDGEVAGFELWPLDRVLAGVRETDDFKFNVSLVLIDLFLRRGMVTGTEAATLRAALDGGGVAPSLTPLPQAGEGS
jgi:8-oxo-dGTP pyrophosphatase MutT (NUDIX family)